MYRNKKKYNGHNGKLNRHGFPCRVLLAGQPGLLRESFRGLEGIFSFHLRNLGLRFCLQELNMPSSRKIILKSSDGVAFDVDEAVALQSQTIKHMIELGCADNEIPLPNVTSKILSKGIEYCKKHVAAPKPEERSCVDEKLKAWNVTSKILSKVIEYCKKHVKAPMPEERSGVDEELKAWDANFVKVDRATLFDLILAANYLNIQSLLDLTCQAVADMIKGKNPVEIAKFFNTDFTPEEEEKLRKENSQINTWRLLALIRPTLALIWKTLNFIYEIETPIVLTPEEVTLQNEWVLE